MSENTNSIADALEQLKSVESEILETGMRLMKSADGNMYTFDLFACATLNRAVAISSAFHTLISDFNMVAAGALLRIHLDTALRYFASHLVDDCNEFAESVIRGRQINQMFDRDRNKMTDLYLSTEFEKRIPGTRGIYKTACGYVHLSDVHTVSVLDGIIDSENWVVGTKISAIDRELSDESYVDACTTFKSISLIIIELVKSWIDYKNDEHSKLETTL